MSLRCDRLCRCAWWPSPSPLCRVFDASLLSPGSRRRPPVLMDVNSSGVDRSVALSPPDSSSCSTCVWFIPCTGSPLTCVIRSPGLMPASNAGLPESTAWWDKQTHLTLEERFSVHVRKFRLLSHTLLQGFSTFSGDAWLFLWHHVPIFPRNKVEIRLMYIYIYILGVLSF